MARGSRRLGWVKVFIGYSTLVLLSLYLMNYWWSSQRPMSPRKGASKTVSSMLRKRPGEGSSRWPSADIRRRLRDSYYPHGLLPYGELSVLRPYGELWNTRSQVSRFFDGSNSTPTDYVGADSCRECHREKFEHWTAHAHRRMNSLASPEMIVGDFSGDAVLNYLGGVMRFFTRKGKYWMSLERDDIRLTYEVTQTIGSRFLQSYVGKLVEGEGEEHLFERNHVLPAMWRTAKSEWVPWSPGTANTNDGQLFDFYSHRKFREYSSQCSICHVTLPLGDWFLRARNAEKFAPRRVDFDEAAYVRDVHSKRLAAGGMPDGQFGIRTAKEFLDRQEATEIASDLGIACEACHNGGREHVDNPKIPPRFGPSGVHFQSNESDWEHAFGRTTQNLNWTCGRCHRAPPDSQYAWGMSTINSSEFVDAHRGSCYSELTCVHCHDPHQTTGLEYRKSSIQNDQLCISCHFGFNEASAQIAHTRHQMSSEGSRCMNCHMPRITEGFEDIVRTHAIHSPTASEFFEFNEPNACNLCHLDKSSLWTMSWLRKWFGTSFSELANQRAGELGEKRASSSWLESENVRVREIAGWTLADVNPSWALPEIVGALDDKSLYVRQYTETSLERSTGIDFASFGYAYWQTGSERIAPMQKIRKHLLSRDDTSQ